jgi:hypothetical protein
VIGDDTPTCKGVMSLHQNVQESVRFLLHLHDCLGWTEDLREKDVYRDL